ncbi:Uma2 family endonuclease [Chloroflexi bacterium TSY]|nr:Uma2 family endonuclease [Chloroflexi bacterium TSY]
MSTTSTTLKSSTIRENLQINGRSSVDWLDDPEEAMARERGPYTIENAECYLDEEPVELYNGWLVWQEMTDAAERTLIGTIQDALSLSARKAGFGQVLPDQLECLLADGSTVKPDACLISWQRLREHVQPYGPRDRPTLMMCPELVIEVRSPSNRRTQEARKRALYFAQGTQIVWDVDEKNRVIYVYRTESPDQPTSYGIEDEIDCQPLLPNWQRRVADIFAKEASAETVAGELVDEWREEGREEGIEIGRSEIARTMLRDDMDLALIVRLTGLTMEQVLSIQKELAE